MFTLNGKWYPRAQFNFEAPENFGISVGDRITSVLLDGAVVVGLAVAQNAKEGPEDENGFAVPVENGGVERRARGLAALLVRHVASANSPRRLRSLTDAASYGFTSVSPL